MNDSRGVRPWREVEMFRRVGVAESPGFQIYPEGEFKCDARSSAFPHIEAREKGVTMERCRLPMSSDPRTRGVEINQSSVNGRGLIMFIVECPGVAEEDDYRVFTGGTLGTKLTTFQGWVAVINGETAAQEFYGNDEGRGGQLVYYIPVELFIRVY